MNSIQDYKGPRRREAEQKTKEARWLVAVGAMTYFLLIPGFFVWIFLWMLYGWTTIYWTLGVTGAYVIFMIAYNTHCLRQFEQRKREIITATGKEFAEAGGWTVQAVIDVWGEDSRTAQWAIKDNTDLPYFWGQSSVDQCIKYRIEKLEEEYFG